MLSAAAKVVAPQLAERFARDSRAFHQAMGRDRAAAVAAAVILRGSARALANAFASADLGRTQDFEHIDTINPETIPRQLPASAGSLQPVMATNTFLSPLTN